MEMLFAKDAKALGIRTECFKCNHEDALIDHIPAAGKRLAAGARCSTPGAFTHTSLALFDATQGVNPLPLIKVHNTNVHARKAIRHHSCISPAAADIAVSLGTDGYRMTPAALVRKALA